MVKNIRSLVLLIISIVVSAGGVAGYWVFDVLTKRLGKSLSEGDFLEGDLQGLIEKYQSHIITQVCFSSLIFIGIIIVLIAQYRKKSLFGLIIGLVLCIYMLVLIILPFIKMLIQM